MGNELLVVRDVPGWVQREELNHVTLQVPNEDLAFLIVAVLLI